MKCPECGGELELQPAETGNASGPPSAWSEEVKARVWCIECDWEADNPREYFEERR